MGEKKSGMGKWNQWLCQSLEVNPYYFVFLLVGLIGANWLQFAAMLKEHSTSPYLFLFYAICQSVLEVGVLFFLANLLKHYFHRMFFYLFVGSCFFFLTLHYVDFLLIRFMDMSVYYALDLAVHETWENFIELIRLSEIGLQKWILFIVFCVFFLPLIAVGLYFLLEKVQKKYSLRLSRKRFLAFFLPLPLVLLVLDILGTSRVSYQNYTHYCRILPWKSTVIAQKGEQMKLSGSLKPPMKEEQITNYLTSRDFTPKRKPNIYLFVIESLREDFIASPIAPHISAFGAENIVPGQTFSGANATHPSWYTIFHSNHALYWSSALKDRYQLGSLPLRLLKKLGYKIHVYSGAQLKYYRLSEMIFGKNRQLATSYYTYPHYFPVKAWQSDEQAMNKFFEEMDTSLGSQGHLCIFFFDSTHFNYSWPESYDIPFSPFSEEGTNLQISNKEPDITLLKNRYKNSIHYVDSLFGKIVAKLKAKGLYRDSVIVLTGDHGEEIFEEGQLFHASHLSRVQTRVPIYYKLGSSYSTRSFDKEGFVSSHVDIFPTIFDYLLGESLPNKLWSGDSIFSDNRSSFVITSRYNGGKAPSTFFIHNGKYKLTAKMKSSRRYGGKMVLQVLSIRDTKGNVIPEAGFGSGNHPFYSVYLPPLKDLFCHSRKKGVKK